MRMSTMIITSFATGYINRLHYRNNRACVGRRTEGEKRIENGEVGCRILFELGMTIDKNNGVKKYLAIRLKTRILYRE